MLRAARSRMFLVSMFVALMLWGVPPHAIHADGMDPRHIDDTFSGQSIDSNIWWFSTDQPGQIEISEGDGYVTVNISGHATSGFNAGLGTRCRAHGNFDARVSFDLADWPAFDGIYVTLMGFDPFNAGFDTYRASQSWGDSYGAYFPPTGTEVPASGRRGALRLVRRGATASGYYLAGQKWVPIFTGTAPTNDTPINLSVFNLGDVSPLGGDWATIRFDEFHLVADAITCP